MRSRTMNAFSAIRVNEVNAIGLKVVPKPLEDDPGHAEIQSDSANLDDHACR